MIKEDTNKRLTFGTGMKFKASLMTNYGCIRRQFELSGGGVISYFLTLDIGIREKGAGMIQKQKQEGLVMQVL